MTPLDDKMGYSVHKADSVCGNIPMLKFSYDVDSGGSDSALVTTAFL